MALTRINNNSLSAVTAAGIPGHGSLVMADHWRLTSDKTDNGDISANLAQVDETGYATLGTAMSQSSGVFTFPSTGKWIILANFSFSVATGDFVQGRIQVTTDNGSNYGLVAETVMGGATGGNEGNVPAFAFVDVTNTTNVKVKFGVNSLSSSTLMGRTSDARTSFMFIRLADT